MSYNPDAPLTEIHISTNGFNDAFTDFDNIFTDDVLNHVYRTASGLIRLAAPGVDLDTVFASGFKKGFDPADTPGSMARCDEFKINVPSSVKDGGVRLLASSEIGDPYFGSAGDYDEDDPYYGGDDSNTVNIHRRLVDGLYRDKRALAGLNADYQSAPEIFGYPDLPNREECAAELRRLNEEIARMEAMDVPMQPVYFATLLHNLLEPVNEDNPVAYSGDVPGVAYLALYDGAALRQDPDLTVTNKDILQIRIAGSGAAVMRHALGVMRLIFTDE